MTDPEITIREQDEIIGRLTRTCDALTKSVEANREWLAKAKRDAGYDNNVSFDTVWKEILEKANAYDELKTKFDTTCEQCLELKRNFL